MVWQVIPVLFLEKLTDAKARLFSKNSWISFHIII